MSHTSPETVARLAARNGRSPVIGSERREPTEAELAEAKKNFESSSVLKSLQQEQKERDAIVDRLLSSPDLDLSKVLQKPDEAVQSLLSFAEKLVAESNRRDYTQIVAEMQRIGEPVPRGLRLICERHGVEVPKSLSVVAPVG